MKNNVMKVSIIMLLSIALVGAIVSILIWQLNQSNSNSGEGPTIDEIIASSVEVPEITTNLANDQFIRLSLMIQTTNPDAAEELTKREFQVKNIVIQELSEITERDFQGKAEKQAFEESIRVLLNPLMQSGDIERVYIVSHIIQ